MKGPMNNRKGSKQRTHANATGLQAWLTVVGILLFSFIGSCAAAQTNTKKVLVIYSFADRQDFSAFNDLRSGLPGALPWPIDFYGESLEGQRLDDKAYDKDLAGNLRNKYGKV